MSSKSRVGGYLIVWIAAALSLFGLLGGWHGLMLLAAARTARAYDTWKQGHAEELRIEQAVSEAALHDAELDSDGRSPAATVQWHLERLEAGGSSPNVVYAPAAWAWSVPFPEPGATPPTFAAPAAALLRQAGPELLRWLGNRIEVSAPCVVRTASERRILGRLERLEYDTRLILVSVPLSRFGLCAYEMPEQLGQTATPFSAAWIRSDLPAGLAPARDVASRGDWLGASGSLPYQHRRRASASMAYRRLFSQATAERLAELAGATHYHDLDQATEADTAVLDGFSRTFEGATWDLGIAGRGRFGSEEKSNDIAIVRTRLPGRRLSLRDSVGSPNAGPLLLVFFGPDSGTQGWLDVHLGSILRPVLVVGVKVRLDAAADAAVRGAIFLDPGSCLAEGTGSWTVGHLSHPAAKATAAVERVRATEEVPEALDTWMPKIRIIAASSQRRIP